MLHRSEQVRLLYRADCPDYPPAQHLLEYTYQPFTLEELKHILKTYPSVGLFRHNPAQFSAFPNPQSPFAGSGLRASVGHESRSPFCVFWYLQLEYLACAGTARSTQFLLFRELI